MITPFPSCIDSPPARFYFEGLLFVVTFFYLHPHKKGAEALGAFLRGMGVYSISRGGFPGPQRVKVSSEFRCTGVRFFSLIRTSGNKAKHKKIDKII